MLASTVIDYAAGLAIGILKTVFTGTTIASFPGWTLLYPTWLAALAIVVVVEWLQRDREHPLDFTGHSRAFRLSVYFSMIIAALLIGSFASAPFIYFQF